MRRPKKPKPDPKVIQENFDYDESTGELFWAKDGPGRGIGVLGTSIANGYRVVGLNYVLYRCHTIAWVCYHGKWPVGYIDHINKNKLDNRIANLREVTPAQNRHYAVKSKNNTSGFIGVCYNKKAKKWQAYAKLNNVIQHLGVFDKPEDGAKAYDQFVMKHRGEFAVTNFKY